MRRTRSIVFHVIAFLLLTYVWVMHACEPFVTTCFPQHHDLEFWFRVMFVGFLLILAGCITSLVLFLKRAKRR
ncbi:MAG: hypothetical protein ABI599_11200 [Flavobacteriales bacterium]